MAPPIQVDVANEQSLLAVDAARLRKTAEQILHDAGVNGGTLSIAIVDDTAIHKINREFLGHDYPTDVLSFALEEDFDAFEGEVIVSAETAIRSAAEIGWPAEDELLLYVAHGALHLAGYRDKTESEQSAMREAEARYLQRVNANPRSSIDIGV